MDLDHIFSNYVGGFGRYQVLMTVALTFLAFVLQYIEIENLVFNFAPRFECRSNFNFSVVNVSETGIADVTLNHCFVWRKNQSALAQQVQESYGGLENAWNWLQLRRDDSFPAREQCKSWLFEHNTYTNTAVTDWGLVCVRSLYIPLADAVFEVGLATVGVTGVLLDSFGRRGCAGVALLLLFIAHCLCAFSFNYVMLIVARFAAGTCIGLCLVAAQALITEYVTTCKRHHALVCLRYAGALALLTQCAVSLILTQWRVIILFNAVITLPALALFFLLESPRWLLTQNRRQKARVTLAKVTSFNNNIFPCYLQLPVINSLYVTSEKNAVTSASERGARHSRIRCKLAFLWFVVALLDLDVFPDVIKQRAPLHRHLLMTSLAVVVGTLAAQIALSFRLGRRRVGFLFFFCATATYLPRHLLEFRHAAVKWCVIVALKVYVTAIENVVLVHTLELVPTASRGWDVGRMFAVSRLVRALCVPHALLARAQPTLLRVLIFLASLAASLVHLLLPETSDAPLCDVTGKHLLVRVDAGAQPPEANIEEVLKANHYETSAIDGEIDDVTRSESPVRSCDEHLWSTQLEFQGEVAADVTEEREWSEWRDSEM